MSTQSVRSCLTRTIGCLIWMASAIVILMILANVILFFFFSSTSIEWVGLKVPNSDVGHMVVNKMGKHCMSFEFLDYRKTDGIYVVRVFDVDAPADFRRLSVVHVRKVSKNGTRIFEDTLCYSSKKSKLGGKFIEMPSSCAPEIEGETLLLDFYVFDDKSGANLLFSRAELHSERIRFLLSI